MGNQLALIKAVVDGDTQASWLAGGDYVIISSQLLVVVVFAFCLFVAVAVIVFMTV